MLELTWVGDALRALGSLYWVLAIATLGVVLVRVKRNRRKLVGAIVVIALFGFLPVKTLLKNKEAEDLRKAAWAHFEMRCKGAGEKIHKTADNVEGVLLMKLRPDRINRSDQFALDDPYGRDFGGEAYVRSFLKGFEPRPAIPIPGAPPRYGYEYVEAVDPKDGQRYRYTPGIKAVGKKDAAYVARERLKDPSFSDTITQFAAIKNLAPGTPPRYGVTYEDISTPEDRKIWVAGSSLRVMDLQTNEVMAERIGYMIDLGQGATGGGRAPWLYAADNACPSFQRNPLRPLEPGHGASAQARQTADFVEKILKPKTGE